MPVIRLSILAVFFALLVGSGLPLFGQQAGDHVVTTDRLNLRSCAGTGGCSVLRTLPRGTQLSVSEREGDWLQVRSVETDETGWVHAGYTEVVEGASSTGSLSTMFRHGLLPKLFVIFCILGALVTMAFFGRNLQEDAAGGQLFALSGLCVLTGAVVLLNQFGPVVAELAAPWVSLQGVSFLWTVNSVTESSISYLGVVLFLGAVTLGVTAVASGANGGRLSFFQGVCTGFFGLPLFTIASLVAALAFYLLSFVFKAVIYVVSLLAIPFIWIFQHIVQPVLRFLAIPFVWLWEHFLRAIVEFLGIPFVWFWKVILRPVGAFLFKWIARPILILLLGVALALVGLLPFGVVGVVMLGSVRNSFRGSLSSDGLFAQGVTSGFLLLDAALLATLNGLEVLHTAPPLSLAVPAALQLVVFLRLLAPSVREPEVTPSPVFQQRLRTYWRSSKLELIATCVIIPVGLLAMLHGEDS